ncbi:MAG: hypothetical protein AB1324_02595 [Candidatus Micrarchaeota archaeon]
MNIVRHISRLNVIGRYVLLSFVVLNLVSLGFAAPSGTSNLESGLRLLCSQAKFFLAVSAMVLVILAGAVYAIGQILGAETRARAAVWATAMLTGAVIGIVIYAIMPPIINALLGSTVSGC